jgi:C1A family cysteine protease
MREALAGGFPVMIGISVFDSFESDEVASTGIVPMPLATESLLGGHCMYAIGYDDKRKAFLVRNSWGSNWGIAGNCWIPYDYLGSTNFGADYWVIKGLAK